LISSYGDSSVKSWVSELLGDTDGHVRDAASEALCALGEKEN
jgi:hypothetical protein